MQDVVRGSTVSRILVALAVLGLLGLPLGSTGAQEIEVHPAGDASRIELTGMQPTATVHVSVGFSEPSAPPRVLLSPGGPPPPGGTAVKISAPLVAGGDVISQATTADGTRAVYLADQDVDGMNELYSVPIAGGTVTQLNAPLQALGNVLAYIVSLDGQWVIYFADGDTDTVQEIYSVPAAGGAAVKLNGPMPLTGDVIAVQLTVDSTRVIYIADQDTDSVNELYSVPIGGGTATKISGPLVAAGDVTNTAVSLDGTRAVYRADQETDEVFELFSVPMAGGPVTKLNPTPVAGGDVGAPTTNGSRVYVIADLDTDDVFESYGVSNAGGPMVKLNGPLTAGGDVTHAYLFSGMAIYSADQVVNDTVELYAVPSTGGPAVKISPPLVFGGDVIIAASSNPNIVEEDTTAVYRADQDVDNVIELYNVSLSGGPTTQLNAPLVLGGNVLAYAATLSASLPRRVVYFADQDADEVVEMYGVALGGGAAAKLNAPLVAGGDVSSAIFTGSGVVIYLADQDVDGINELFSSTTTGLGPEVQLNAPLVPGGIVVGFSLASEVPTHAVYRADQDTDEVFELYSTALDGDADGDAVVDGQDCLAYDGTVWSVPGEVAGLALSHTGGVGGTTTLAWGAPVSPGGTSLVYDTVRSASASDFVTSATCVESDDGPNTTTTDSITPAAGEVAFFQVRAQDICGDGSLGTTSGGNPRVARDCP